MRGLFVTFEGVEGAGKTTQIALLKAALEQQGRRVCVTREPGGDAVAEGVRQLLLSQEMSPRAELLLFLASRAQNVERVIKPELAQGAIVLCDRFIDSSIAYQGVARGLGRDAVAALNEFATGGLLPEITFLLDLDPQTGLTRQTDRNRMEEESLDFHQRVRQGYLQEAERSPDRFCVVDATLPPDTLHTILMGQLQEILSSRILL